MLIVLSPAKTLDYETPTKIRTKTTPELIDHSEQLVDILRKMTPKRLGKLLGTSEALTLLNHQRYQDWRNPMPAGSTKQAVLTFDGDVYQGMQANKMTEKQLMHAQDHLRILSGLYGILRPLDAMLPYRLEMGTALKTKRGKDLYAFWGSLINESINRQLEATRSKHLLHLASNEYFRSLNPKQIDAEIIAPSFKDLSNGKYRVLSFFAKKARGAMAAWVIKKKIKSADKLSQFVEDGYRYDPKSSTANKPVFLRG